jgi:integrase
VSGHVKRGDGEVLGVRLIIPLFPIPEGLRLRPHGAAEMQRLRSRKGASDDSSSLPVVLSRQEVRHFLGCVESRKHRAILTTCYAAGLGISEAVHLKAAALDSRRMVIRVEQAKGRKSLPRGPLAHGLVPWGRPGTAT